jgi:hypothetical protein
MRISQTFRRYMASDNDSVLKRTVHDRTTRNALYCNVRNFPLTANILNKVYGSAFHLKSFSDCRSCKFSELL